MRIELTFVCVCIILFRVFEQKEINDVCFHEIKIINYWRARDICLRVAKSWKNSLKIWLCHYVSFVQCSYINHFTFLNQTKTRKQNQLQSVPYFSFLSHIFRIYFLHYNFYKISNTTGLLSRLIFQCIANVLFKNL